MELQKDDRPLTAKFTATEACRIVSPNGAKCMNFEAGETLAVHRDLFTVAIDVGLIPEEPLHIEEKSVIENKTYEQDVSDQVTEACRQLILKGDPKDFTLAGLPRAASVKKLVDCEFKTIDVQKAFEQAIHEVEHGNDSEERPESSSSDSE